MGPGGGRGDQACGVWRDQAPGIQAESAGDSVGLGYRGDNWQSGGNFSTLYSTTPGAARVSPPH